MGAKLQVRVLRTAAVAGCLVAAAWIVGSCTGVGFDSVEARFMWLLRRDGRLLADIEAPSWLDRLTIPSRARRLDRAYRSFVDDHPSHARAKVAYGCFLYDHGRDTEAIQAWEAAIDTDPGLAVAYNNLAEHYAHHGRPKEAFRYYDRVLELAPDRALFHYNWALMTTQYRRDAGQHYGWDRAEVLERGLAGFRRARDLEPSNVFYATACAEGYRYLAEPDWDGAYDAWLACLDRDQVNDVERQRICGRLARICQRLRRFDEAEQWLAKMTRSELESMRSALERKQAALLAGQPDTVPVMMRAGAGSTAMRQE